MKKRKGQLTFFDPCPAVIQAFFNEGSSEVTHTMRLKDGWYLLHVENRKGDPCACCIGTVIDGEAAFLAPGNTTQEIDFMLSVFSTIVHQLTKC